MYCNSGSQLLTAWQTFDDICGPIVASCETNDINSTIETSFPFVSIDTTSHTITANDDFHLNDDYNGPCAAIGRYEQMPTGCSP